jgi:hypothetical protein
MSVYGVNLATGNASNGQIPFTGWSPTLGVGPANTGATSGAVWYNGQTQNDYFIMSNVSRMSNRGFAALIKALTGAAPGAAALAQYRRVMAANPTNTGLVPIETIQPVNRNTTSGDQTMALALWNRTVNPTTYPPDLSGAGGGGKLSFIGVS